MRIGQINEEFEKAKNNPTRFVLALVERIGVLSPEERIECAKRIRQIQTRETE